MKYAEMYDPNDKPVDYFVGGNGLKYDFGMIKLRAMEFPAWRGMAWRGMAGKDIRYQLASLGLLHELDTGHTPC